MPKKAKYAQPVLEYSPPDPIAALDDMAERLLGLEFPSSPIRVEDAHWMARAIKRALARASKDPTNLPGDPGLRRDSVRRRFFLDRELGIRGHRGKKRRISTEDDVALLSRILPLIRQGKSLSAICDEVGWEGEESSLSQFCERVLPDYSAEKAAVISDRLNSNPFKKPGSKN